MNKSNGVENSVLMGSRYMFQRSRSAPVEKRVQFENEIIEVEGTRVGEASESDSEIDSGLSSISWKSSPRDCRSKDSSLIEWISPREQEENIVRANTW